jgi:hypothetical protein
VGGPEFYHAPIQELGGVAMVKWQTLACKTVVWLATEVILETAGLSQLANYSEFLAERSQVIFSTGVVGVGITWVA